MPEWWRDLVLDDLDPGSIARDQIALLDGRNPSDIDPDRGVELECVAARRRLRTSEHHTDLHANLIDEDDRCARFRDGSRQLAQRLTHQASLQTDMRIAHLPFDLRTRHQGRHRVDNDEIDCSRSQQDIRDLERFFPCVRL